MWCDCVVVCVDGGVVVVLFVYCVWWCGGVGWCVCVDVYVGGGGVCECVDGGWYDVDYELWWYCYDLLDCVYGVCW